MKLETCHALVPWDPCHSWLGVNEEGEETEDGVVEMKGDVEVVVENVWVMSEGDVDEIQKRDNTDKAERIIQEIVTNLLE